MPQPKWYHKHEKDYVSGFYETGKVKKKVDKPAVPVYNIRTRYEGSKALSIEELITKHSINPDRSHITLSDLAKVGKRLKGLYEKGKIPNPYISGGVIRDLIYGIRVNDIDIFFEDDSSDGDFLSIEDKIHLYASEIAGTLVYTNKQEGEYPTVSKDVGFCVYGTSVVLNREGRMYSLDVIGHPKNNIYQLKSKKIKAGKIYQLRLSVNGAGGTNSNGTMTIK